MKLAVVIFNVEANGTRSRLDLSTSSFCIMEFSRFSLFSQDLHVKNPRLFVSKSAIRFIVCEA